MPSLLFFETLQAGERLGVIGLELKSFFVHLAGGVASARLLLDETKEVVRIGIGRVEPDARCELLKGFVCLALVEKNNAQIALGTDCFGG